MTVVYARYSCDKQTEQSIEGQLRVCKEYAQRNDILILKTYVDEAISGTTDKRDEFQHMIKDSAKKEWDYVLVYKLDRFSRDKYATAIYKKTLKDNGIKVLSCMENIPDTPEGIILESLLEGMNQYYSAELSQKVKRGMKELRLKGNWQGGHIPYGYKVENKKIIPKEIEAENVKFIFSQIALGFSAPVIIEQLKEDGRFCTGRNLTPGVIYQMVRNTRYLGWYKKDDELVANMFPALISQELFDKVQAKLPKSNKGKKSNKAVYLLRTKLKCGYCGQNLNGETGTSHTGNKKYYYKCRSIKDKLSKCKKTTVPRDMIENQVIDIIRAQLSIPKNKDLLIQKILDFQNNSPDTKEIIEQLEKQKQEIVDAMQNIMIAIEKGFVCETSLARMKELETKKKEVERLITKKQKRNIIKLTKKDITKYFEDAIKQEPSVLIDTLIEKIVLYNDKKEIYFNSPLKNKGPDDKSQDFLFYTEIKNADRTSEIVRFYL